MEDDRLSPILERYAVGRFGGQSPPMKSFSVQSIQRRIDVISTVSRRVVCMLHSTNVVMHKEQPMKSRKMSLAIIASLLCGMFGGALATAYAGTNGIIHACVKDGNLRILSANQTCKSNETALDWNIQGPQGPKGDKGDTGPQGMPGAAGAKGDT